MLLSNSAPSRRFRLADLAVLAALAAVIYAIVEVADEWRGQMRPVAPIELGLAHLPFYTLMSLARGITAYLLSFAFTLAYGYAAARIRSAERILIPLLDILQSIPVLGFLPGVVLALLHLFPHRNFGLELASILMIFTGQVWNMTFSFYNSLKSVPPDLMAVSRLSRLTRGERFLHLELPYAANGLVWNSMMSMAGGWFFLSVSEAFVLQNQDFRLPGLGAYMAVAIEQGNAQAQVMGVLAMLTMIVFLDQIVWRPVVAWSQRFNVEEREASGESASWLWNQLGRSRLAQFFARLLKSFGSSHLHHPTPPVSKKKRDWSPATSKVFSRFVSIILVLLILYAAFRYFLYLTSVTSAQWFDLFISTILTFSRVLAAVALGTLWAVPVGVAIGRNKKLAQRLQPVIQMAASFPAPMIFPLVLALFLSMGAGLGIGSIFLLLLGTQWYILFNVISGSSSIPVELWEVSRLNRLNLSERWRKLILPAIFPALVTGWITAMGGAWNASIVAEYIKFKGQTLTTPGLGSLISKATDSGEFALLAASIGVMSFSVVAFNKFVWHRLSHLAQTRFSLS